MALTADKIEKKNKMFKITQLCGQQREIEARINLNNIFIILKKKKRRKKKVSASFAFIFYLTLYERAHHDR